MEEQNAAASSRFLSAGDAHTQAMSLPIGAIVTRLLELLDAMTIAMIAGVQKTRAVHSRLGGREPRLRSV